MPRKRSFRGRRRRSKFVKRVHRAEIINAPTKKATFISAVGNNVVSGDGTSRTLIAYTPLSDLVQGDAVSNFTGRSIYPTMLAIRGNFAVTAARNYSIVTIRWTLFWSRSQAYYTGGQVFGNTTRSNLAPAQTAPNANPRIFDSVTAAYSPFVSDSFGTQYDNTNIRVIKTKTKVFNAGGAAIGAIPFKFVMRFPRRKLTWQNPAEQSLTTPPNLPLTGNYYLIQQAFGDNGTGNIATTVLGTMDIHANIYWKDDD